MQILKFTPNLRKENVNKLVVHHIVALGLTITSRDTSKPWGAYFVIDDDDIDLFIKEYFAGQDINRSGKLTPKILVVAPTEILSWQYHHRRAELWKVVTGPVEIVQSETDGQTSVIRKYTGDLITHGALIRHRLIGAGVWGVIAEIWQHTDPQNPSDEDDIVRISDAYGR
ncbi:MAG TPA: phosphoheptose isomerase [Candidatus Woesebacteria bacterium]|nr:phosphoheptose isomerase [Candidatus Woesebacteria bacterium]HNS95007.1 phosphoheptose isomerase [Candidatus Woesebacteria bacterium]